MKTHTKQKGAAMHRQAPSLSLSGPDISQDVRQLDRPVFAAKGISHRSREDTLTRERNNCE